MSAQKWREGLFEEFKNLVEIQIGATSALVPANNRLLRCFQYIRMETVSVGDYCWNGDCGNCTFWYKGERGDVRSALACRFYVKPGMVIMDLSSNLKRDLSE